VNLLGHSKPIHKPPPRLAEFQVRLRYVSQVGSGEKFRKQVKPDQLLQKKGTLFRRHPDLDAAPGNHRRENSQSAENDVENTPMVICARYALRLK
jgi:hypothetical protein